MARHQCPRWSDPLRRTWHVSILHAGSSTLKFPALVSSAFPLRTLCSAGFLPCLLCLSRSLLDVPDAAVRVSCAPRAGFLLFSSQKAQFQSQPLITYRALVSLLFTLKFFFPASLLLFSQIAASQDSQWHKEMDLNLTPVFLYLFYSFILFLDWPNTNTGTYNFHWSRRFWLAKNIT